MSLSEARRWERYMQRRTIDPKTGCWNWTGKIKRGPCGGYAIIKIDYQDVRAHRAFYERFVGPIPDGLLVRHSCDNRRCVNPEHLLVGTNADNSNDMIVRGRSNKKEFCPRGHRLGDRVYADGSRCVECRRERASRYTRRIAAAALVAAAIVPSVAVDASVSRPMGSTITRAKAPAVRADVTRLVQQRLHDFGYTIKVDSVYGPQTRRVVSAWQKANGLTVDGIAGPATVASLGPVNFATAAPSPAVRSSPPVPIPVGSESVEAIIRDVWPDDLEDWAVKIATRESNLQPGVSNACCYGLFQIHFHAHQSWLDEYGVNQPSDLFDPRVNATVALALYQQTGPGPWNL